MKRILGWPSLAAALVPTGITIYDGAGNWVANLTTDRPEWSFDQWCRNRVPNGYTWKAC